MGLGEKSKRPSWSRNQSQWGVGRPGSRGQGYGNSTPKVDCLWLREFQVLKADGCQDEEWPLPEMPIQTSDSKQDMPRTGTGVTSWPSM